MTMTASADRPSENTPSAAACAEAAAWVARLHGEDRTASVEAGFKRWLAASAEHRAAFEMANEIWVGAEQLPKPAAPAFVRWPRAALVVTVPRALTAVGVAAIAISLLLHFRDPGLATRVGEQRNLSLEDGTRISLNTASRVHVHYDRTARRVELDDGAERPQLLSELVVARSAPRSLGGLVPLVQAGRSGTMIVRSNSITTSSR